MTSKTPRAWPWWIVVVTCCLWASRCPASSAAPRTIPGDDPAIQSSGFAARAVLPDHGVRFNRPFGEPGRGYEWDNPGAKIRFRTDARQVVVHLRFSEKHTSKSARAPVGLYYVDGRTEPAWTFRSEATEVVRPVETVALPLPVPADHAFHDYTVVLPYGDSVDFGGLTVDAAAKFETPPQLKLPRYVACGDSITHGFTASHVGLTYPYRMAETRGWELVNLGIGGRIAHALDGEAIARVGGDVMTLLIGGNDWQGGVEPAAYRTAVAGLLDGVRRQQPTLPIYVITPLWVSAEWRPAKTKFDLEVYRQALRELLADRKDPALYLVEGPSLIDHDERYFDRVLVHPNDAGFAQMAERLSAQIAQVNHRAVAR